MRAQDLTKYARECGRFLADEHGFTLAGRRYTRSDELLRSCWFIPLNATPDRYIFDVLVDVGIPGISSFGPRAQIHVVRANAQQSAQGHPDYPRPEFILIADGDGRPIAPGVDEVVRRLAADLLLRYATPTDLYEAVRATALRSAREGDRSDDDFGRLRLLPGAPGRMELAAVYGTFLGRDDEAEEILEMVREYAPAHRIDYFIPKIEASVAEARRVRTSL
jgi:hypothetical protein